MVKIILYQNDKTLEEVEKKIEIPGKVVGSRMNAGVMDIMGWHLAMQDKEHATTIVIDGDNEIDLLTLKEILKRVTINVSILVPLKLP